MIRALKLPREEEEEGGWRRRNFDGFCGINGRINGHFSPLFSVL